MRFNLEKSIQKTYLKKVVDGKTKFWRTDNLELTDRGITACEARD